MRRKCSSLWRERFYGHPSRDLPDYENRVKQSVCDLEAADALRGSMDAAEYKVGAYWLASEPARCCCGLMPRMRLKAALKANGVA